MKTCIVCEVNDDLVKKFTDTSFQKVCSAIEIRKSNGHKYGDLIITAEKRENYGFHVTCYKKVTCLKKKLSSDGSEKGPSKRLRLITPSKETSYQDLSEASSKPRVTQHDSPSLLRDQPTSSDQHGEQEYEDARDLSEASSEPRVTQHDSLSLLRDQPTSSHQHGEQEYEDARDLSEALSEPRVTQHDSPSLLRDQPTLPHQHGEQEYEDARDLSEASPEPRVTQRDSPSLLREQPTSSHRYGEKEYEYTHNKSEESSELRTTQQDPSILTMDQPTPFPPTAEPTTSQQCVREKKKDNLCIFCLSHSIRVGSVRQYPNQLTDIVRATSIASARALDDIDLLQRLLNSNIQFYHRNCLSLLQKRYQSSLDILSDESVWHNKRSIHKHAFDCLTRFIEEEIIMNENIIYLSDLFTYYKSIISELESESFEKYDFSTFTAQHLQNKVNKHFGDLVVFGKSSTVSKKIILYKKEIDVQKLANEVLINKTQFFYKLNEVAYTVRNSVKANTIKNLPLKLTPEAVIQGECEIPNELYMLISALVKGPDPRRKLSNDDNIKIDAVCQDLIYIITKGVVKPKKHLQLGLTVKSWTNSRKTMDILNKLGHSISYTMAEGLETELTYTAYERNQIIPSGISPMKGLSTHVAFDNYDRFVETTTGKDTLHDTVGIIYQNKTEATVTTANELDSNLGLPTQNKRRTFSAIPHDIEPYFKKPKLSTTLIPIEDIPNDSDIVNDAVVRDAVWVMSLSRLPEVTPMWAGYNVKTCTDKSTIQIIDYLPQINLSPTSYAVVQETMKYAEKIRLACDESYIITTYDLAIAKMANQIQYAESPKYDNLFINFGAFHIQLAFFKALGKILDGCGIEHIMTECEVLAAGSLNGFLSAKHYNRCKRIHVLLSAAIQILHFSRFIEDSELEVTQIDKHLDTLLESNSDPKKPLELPKLLETYVTQYREFSDLTMTGEHGKTAEFYMKYVQLVNTYLQFIRSIKTNDFNLYSVAILKMTNLFFALNQPNYARWMLKYHYDLYQMKKDNPALLAEFNNGAFGIKRTDVPLSRSPVDLVLEQTINANAGNRLTGLTQLTNSIGARQRWALNHSIRTKIVSAFIEDLNVSNTNKIHVELQEAKLKKNKQTLQNLISEIQKNINPFDRDLNKNELFNISTGKAANSEISNFLLNVNDIGQRQKLKFIEECNADPTRFEKPIKRNKINNFTIASYTKTIKDRDNMKITQIKMQRDIFGRLLAISLEKKIDIAECLSYPLAPAPPALSDFQGYMLSTPKSKLSSHLISLSESLPCASETPSLSPKEDILLVDGFHFLRNVGFVPETFGKLAELIMRKLCVTPAEEIHLIFDRYFSPSIKDMERSKRDSIEVEYQIVGPTQKTDKDYKKNLQNTKFKEALVSFFCEYWVDDIFKMMINNKKIFVTNQEKCLSYVVENNSKIIQSEEKEYECEHEESDTRIIFHLQQSAKTKCLIKASDTDIMIIVLGNLHKFPNKEIWMSYGTNKVAINISSIYKNIGPGVSKALPAMHAYTGSDYTASFKGKGKIKPFKILQKDQNLQEVFASLNHPSHLDDDQKMKTIQKFTNELYGLQGCFDVNEARFKLFCKKYGSCEQTKFLKKIVNFDSHNIPPCWRSLKQKILRTIYVTAMWQNATAPICTFLSPDSCGWQINEKNKYMVVWFEGEPTPLRIDDIMLHDVSDSEEEEDMNISSSDEEFEF